jgi:malate dehydrogenase
VALDGEFALGGAPIRGVLGVPVVLGPEGWSGVLLKGLAPDEEALLLAAQRRIRSVCAPYTGKASDDGPR